MAQKNRNGPGPLSRFTRRTSKRSAAANPRAAHLELHLQSPKS
jgi:hypothetical protein